MSVEQPKVACWGNRHSPGAAMAAKCTKSTRDWDLKISTVGYKGPINANNSTISVNTFPALMGSSQLLMTCSIYTR